MKSFQIDIILTNVKFQHIFPLGQIRRIETTAVHEPSAKYYQLLGLHGRRWRKWLKIWI